MRLEERELERYDRQIRIIGREGQEKLKNSRVLVAGVGGLGGAAATYLTGAGVGLLRLVDNGRVELSNLNRQLIYSENDLGRLKVEAAAERLREINPDIEIEVLAEKINEENVSRILNGVDLVVDGQDNFKTRFILNDECIRRSIPFIHGAVQGFEGRLMNIIPGETPCLRCLIPKPPPERDVIPVIGAVAGVIGVLEALEAVKILLNSSDYLRGLLIFDGRRLEFEVLEIRRSPDCPVCSKKFGG